MGEDQKGKGREEEDDRRLTRWKNPKADVVDDGSDVKDKANT